MCRDWKRLLFHGLHLTFLRSHDTTFKQGIKPLISVNSTPSGQFWRPFWYEWGISSTRQCPQFPIVLMTNGLLWWWLLFWIIAFHVLGVVCISGFLITRLPDYPNCHNCIAMGRLLHAGLINLINISRQRTHANQRIIRGVGGRKNKEIFVRTLIHLYAQLPFPWECSGGWQCEKQILIIALSPFLYNALYNEYTLTVAADKDCVLCSLHSIKPLTLAQIICLYSKYRLQYGLKRSAWYSVHLYIKWKLLDRTTHHILHSAHYTQCKYCTHWTLHTSHCILHTKHTVHTVHTARTLYSCVWAWERVIISSLAATSPPLAQLFATSTSLLICILFHEHPELFQQAHIF